MRTRRTVLAAAGALLGAGCLGGPRAPGADDEPPEGSPVDGTGSPDDCASGYSVTAEPFEPAADLPLGLDGPERALLEDALADGPVTVERYSAESPLPDGAYVEHEDAFFEVAVTAAEASEIPALSLDVEWEAGRTPPGGATPVAFADLPAADREALGYALDGDQFGGERGERPSESLTIREFPAPYPDGTGTSALADAGETWVRRNDRVYRVSAGEETTTERYRFRVETSRVAGDAAAFREHVAGGYLVDLSGLSEDATAVLEQAAGDGYRECDPASDGLAELRERLPEDGLLPPPENDAWYVRLDGERYALTVLSWVH